eukprot:scaffold29618_cov183-Amphora_coffeaeformis.AAC.2
MNPHVLLKAPLQHVATWLRHPRHSNSYPYYTDGRNHPPRCSANDRASRVVNEKVTHIHFDRECAKR